MILYLNYSNQAQINNVGQKNLWCNLLAKVDLKSQKRVFYSITVFEI